MPGSAERRAALPPAAQTAGRRAAPRALLSPFMSVRGRELPAGPWPANNAPLPAGLARPRPARSPPCSNREMPEQDLPARVHQVAAQETARAGPQLPVNRPRATRQECKETQAWPGGSWNASIIKHARSTLFKPRSTCTHHARTRFTLMALLLGRACVCPHIAVTQIQTCWFNKC
jgi:hypothetical protein